MRKRAVERNLEIIGELLTVLQEGLKFEKSITEAKSIIGLRNQVIHLTTTSLMRTFGQSYSCGSRMTELSVK